MVDSKTKKLSDKSMVKVHLDGDTLLQLKECELVMRLHSREETIREAIRVYIDWVAEHHGKIQISKPTAPASLPRVASKR